MSENTGFTFGDVAKYSATHHGAKLVIADWKQFDKDWGILKKKAKAFDELTISMSEDLNLTPEDFLERKEDAEKWRKLHREDPDATIDIYEEFDGAIEELNFLRDQLENIERVCRQMNTIDVYHKDKELTKVAQRVLKILGEEFERSDDSILSKHIAIKTILDEATGGEFYVRTENEQSWVKYEAALRYYHAVCKALEILEEP